MVKFMEMYLRVYAVRHWIQLQLKDPVAHCLEHYKKDFLSPESVRVVEGSIKYGFKERFFDMKLSGVTRAGGRSHTEVVCIGNYGDKRMYLGNKELEREIRSRESSKSMREAAELIENENKRLELELKRREMERERGRN